MQKFGETLAYYEVLKFAIYENRRECIEQIRPHWGELIEMRKDALHIIDCWSKQTLFIQGIPYYYHCELRLVIIKERETKTLLLLGNPTYEDYSTYWSLNEEVNFFKEFLPEENCVRLDFVIDQNLRYIAEYVFDSNKRGFPYLLETQAAEVVSLNDRISRNKVRGWELMFDDGEAHYCQWPPKNHSLAQSSSWNDVLNLTTYSQPCVNFKEDHIRKLKNDQRLRAAKKQQLS